MTSDDLDFDLRTGEAVEIGSIIVIDINAGLKGVCVGKDEKNIFLKVISKDSKGITSSNINRIFWVLKSD